MYRYAAPQRGRYREHWQLSVEAIGSTTRRSTPRSSSSTTSCSRASASPRYQLALNSIGDATCRPAYLEQLTAWLDEHEDVLDDDARQKRATNPLRVFDVKDPSASRRRSPTRRRSATSLCDACRAHFDAVRRYLDELRRRVRRSSRRSCAGSTTTRARPGSSSAEAIERAELDDLRRRPLRRPRSRQLGGKPTPGVGFGAGIERLLLALEAGGEPRRRRDSTSSSRSTTRGDEPRVLAARPGCAAAGFAPTLDYAGRSLKGQLTQAGRLGAQGDRRSAAGDARRCGGAGSRTNRSPTAELTERLRR